MSVDIQHKYVKLVKDFSQNLRIFPPKSIQRGVMLLSKGNMANQSNHSIFYDHITERPRQTHQKVSLSSFQLDEEILLIDPTRRLLQSEEGCNFVVQHYLLRTMKQAKFIFVFDQSQLQSPIKQFTNTILRFSQLFRTDRGIQNLADACGFVFLDTPLELKNIEMRLYTKGVNEPGFIHPKDRILVDLCEQIFAKRNVFLVKQFTDNNEKKKYIHRKPFIEFVNKLKYYNLQNPDGQFNTSLPVAELYTQYQQISTSDNTIAKCIKKIFELFIQNLSVFVDKKTEPLKQLPKDFNRKTNQQLILNYGENALIQIINSVGWATTPMMPAFNPLQKKMKVESSMERSESQRLMSFISDYIDVIAEFYQTNDSSSFAKKLLSSIYKNGYLQNRQIQQFLLSGEHFLRCFPKIVTEGEISLTPICQKIEHFNSNIYTLIYRYVDFMEEDLKRKINLPYDAFIAFFSNQVCLRLKNSKAAISNRMMKKLDKCRAEVAYLKAKRNQDESKKAKFWLDFLKLSIEMSLIEQEKKEEAFLIIGVELERKKEWQLALKIYQQISLFKSYQKIIAIYEKRYKFAPQMMKYMRNGELSDNLTQFIKYCQFLMSLGFNQKVREICYEGLRLSNNPTIRQQLQNHLINARGDNYKSLHHKFLQEAIIDKSPIKYDERLLDEVENVFIR